jgi:hypothetical protein
MPAGGVRRHPRLGLAAAAPGDYGSLEPGLTPGGRWQVANNSLSFAMMPRIIPP